MYVEVHHSGKFTMEKRHNICVLDIKNIQEEYSYALEFIEILENIKSENDYKLKLDSIREITNNISVKGGSVQAGISAIYYEKPLDKIEPSTHKATKENLNKSLKRLSFRMFTPKMIPYLIKNDMLYHIRIHMIDKNDNFSQLQYLALLMQRLDFMFAGLSDTRKRLSVFIVPDSADIYPFYNKKGEFDEINYICSSKYLQLLSNEYKGVIFGAVKNGENNADIKALNFKITTQPENFFPLIPMNKNNYDELFEHHISRRTLEELFALIKNARKRNFRVDSKEEAKDQFYDYIAESSLRKLEEKFRNQAEGEIEEKTEVFFADILKTLMEEGERVNWISFALFCFMFPTNIKQNVQMQAKKLWKLVQNLFDGLKQIVQNAIQHSEKRSCVFSFYLKDNDKLKILISDLNYSQTMVEKFADTLEIEYKNCEERSRREIISNLKNNQNKIFLRNLFGEFKEADLKKEWREFRRLNSSAHVGLMLFGVTTVRCNATICVHSCISYKLQDLHNYYHYTCENGKIREYNKELDMRVIPGTQYMLEIPIEPLEKSILLGLGQVQNNKFIREDYQTFAEYLDYTEEKLDCERFFAEVRDIVNNEEFIHYAEKKLLVIKQLRVKWESVLHALYNNENQKILYIDMDVRKYDILENTDQMEVFIKSFFEAIVGLKDEGVHALAILNLDVEFMRVFKDICIVFAARKFPENLQLFICSDNYMDSMILCGKTFYEAVHNGYLLAIEHGTRGIDVFEYARTRELYTKINNINDCDDKKRTGEIKIIPFDTILSGGNKDKIFDRRIIRMSDSEIDGNTPGYRISNTHMRLGSKVHIQSFYEMSFLFYRTSVANRIAFEILQNLIERKSFSNVNVTEDNLIFYGYASYSKAILTSVIEILNYYKLNKRNPKEKSGKVAFISYQHNLQSESEDVQMYYGFPKGFPAKVEGGKVLAEESIGIVQIVPISSTLTTFEKMWGRLKKDILEENINNFKLMANYSVYWVMHIDAQTKEGKPSALERRYWKSYNANEHLITTNFKTLNCKIYYFIRQSAIWHNPLSCEMCYPQNLLDEVPLVETDQTSTVPTQQIRRKKDRNVERGNLPDNNERFLMLRDCVVYGHIKRSKNHFQYYIDTQLYFYSVKDLVREWLELCRVFDEGSIQKINYPCINIIFSPEHNTNVGFAQYVNTYYFGGMAEVVSINEDKEFRSNFECEHKALMNTIEHILSNARIESQKEMPVKFYFVDDTIISGVSFQKANSFLKTLLPDEYKNKYSANVISKCFLLIDRMSDDTKRNYVTDAEHDFYSFVHIDVSNLRTQGDSCIGCKLEKDAIKLFKRSSTNHITTYWSNKMADFKPISYDDKERIHPYKTRQAFHRLLIAHVTQNVIFKDNDYFDFGNVYDSILAIAFKILDINVNELNKRVDIKFDMLLHEVRDIDSIDIFFKVISRPFFTFDFKVRLQVFTLLIALMEILLENEKKIKEYVCESEEIKIYKGFLLEKNRLNLTVRLGKEIAGKLGASRQVEFIQNCLIRCLADMRSTYLLRKETITNIYQYLCKKDKNEHDGGSYIYDEFWHTYAYHIHYILDCSNDEMRSLGLEYLLLTGKEYKEFIEDTKKHNKNNFVPLFLYESITGKRYPESRDTFYIFCHEILLQNTRIYFDGLEKDLERNSNEKDSYYMEQWAGVCSLEQFKIFKWEDYSQDQKRDLPMDAEKELFYYLKKESDNTNSLQEVKYKYENLLQKITNMIHEKRKISLENIKMALLTLDQDDKTQAAISNLDILTEINASEAAERYNIKNKIVRMLNGDEAREFDLTKDGYAISESEAGNSYIVIYFKNQENTKENQEDRLARSAPRVCVTENQAGRTMRTIAKVLLFICIEQNPEHQLFYCSRFILRDLLVYKNRFMRILETDFASDMFTKYAHTIDEKNIFAHEKAINHSSIRDSDELQLLLEKHTISERYDMLEYNECIKWLTLKNYVNEKIARLFNRCFRIQSEGGGKKGKTSVQMEAPQLYIGGKESEYLSDNPFCRKLKYFRELNFLNDDRFVLIMDVVQIEYRNLKKAEMITRIEEEGEKAYNQEYMKCIILDMLISAIKSSSCRPDFLEKINWYRKEKMQINAGGMLSNERVEELRKNQCVVEIYRKPCQRKAFDYLVFQNRVKITIPDLEAENREIERRLQDPLDYSDGHMSLLTIKKYIEGLKPELEDETVFKYIKTDDELVFVSMLPILKKEGKGE